MQVAGVMSRGLGVLALALLVASPAVAQKAPALKVSCDKLLCL
jgi:hypothetical protein